MPKLNGFHAMLCAGQPAKLMSAFSRVGLLFGVEAYLKSLNNVAKERNIDVRTRHNLIEVDTKNKIAKFELLDEDSVPNGEFSEIPKSRLMWKILLQKFLLHLYG
ncbi:hypothetical protein COOONC_12837 [Cooperia oncophora]